MRFHSTDPVALVLCCITSSRRPGLGALRQPRGRLQRELSGEAQNRDHDLSIRVSARHCPPRSTARPTRWGATPPLSWTTAASKRCTRIDRRQVPGRQGREPAGRRHVQQQLPRRRRRRDGSRRLELHETRDDVKITNYMFYFVELVSGRLLQMRRQVAHLRGHPSARRRRIIHQATVPPGMPDPILFMQSLAWADDKGRDRIARSTRECGEWKFPHEPPPFTVRDLNTSIDGTVVRPPK